MHVLNRWLITLLVLTGIVCAFHRTDGQNIVDSDGNPVQLRGIGLGGWIFQEGYMVHISINQPGGAGHTNMRAAIADLIGEEATAEYYAQYESNFFNEGDVQRLADWGYNHIRLPFGYKTLYDRETGLFVEAGFELFDDVIEWCRNHGIYIILDMHAAPGAQSHSDISDSDGVPRFWTEHAENKPIAIAIWQEIARRYSEEEQIIGYDILNESVLPSGWSNTILRNYYEEVTDSIRTLDTNHILFFEGSSWGNDFTLLTPPWDDNMVYSFHKYWNELGQESLGWVMDIRDQYNVPLWMGESGENSNNWIHRSVQLYEENNIGWCFWTHKKMQTTTSPFSAIITDGYREVTDYLAGHGAIPDVDEAIASLMGMAENLASENCIYRPGVVPAMIDPEFSTRSVPFRELVIPGTIHGVDYDIGAQGVGYFDNDYQVTNFFNGDDDHWNRGWQYRNDGVDIEISSDPEGIGYNLGWIEDGEWLKFTVNIETEGDYTISFRVASDGGGGEMRLLLDEAFLVGDIHVEDTGGWQAWDFALIEGVTLPAGTHELKLEFVTGGFNFARMDFEVEGNDPITSFELQQNYPNPFNNGTTFRYVLVAESEVVLEVFDLLGQHVETIVNERQVANLYTVPWNPLELSSGIYFFHLKAGDFEEARKMVLVR